MIENLIITGWNQIWDILSASYSRNWANPEWESQFQRYVDWVAIEWANERTYQALQSWEYVIAVLPVDNQGNEWDIIYSDPFSVADFEKEEPIEKEYLVKLYDRNLNFVKVIPLSIITNDISFSESIDAGQWELVLNLNLPIDTDYFDWVKYIKVFVNDNSWLNDFLIYSWYLSKYSRIYSNNRENIQATFLSIFSLFNEIFFKNWAGDTQFTTSWDPATLIKNIVDQVSEFYPNLFSYTAESIVDYWETIDLEVIDRKCWDLIQEIVSWTNYHFFVWADWIVKYQPKPTQISHYFTYERDIKALTIPTDFEQVVNAVRVQYWYIWWPHSWITDRAENSESIAKFWRKEITIVNQSIYWEASANIYRDQYLQQNSKGKENISVTVSCLYQIETIHPWDTIKIRNLWIDIAGLQVSSISYQYEQAVLRLEYVTNLWAEIFSSNI